MKMKRGFLFAVLFTLLLLVFFSLVAFYVKTVYANERSIAAMGEMKKISFVVDDVTSDFPYFLEMGARISRESGNGSNYTLITIDDRIPSSMRKPSRELAEYVDFVENIYAPQVNLGIELDVSRLNESPHVHFSGYGLNYSYPTLEKNEMLISGVKETRNYSFSARIGDVCAFNRCDASTNDSMWEWVGESMLFVSLDIRDANGSQVYVKGQKEGYVYPAKPENYFTVELENGGVFRMDVGGIFRMDVGGINAVPFSLKANITETHFNARSVVKLNNTPEISAILPVEMRITPLFNVENETVYTRNITIPNLVLMRK